jgi:ABC-type antimicrobial peptide transport system permease subunit
MEATSSYNTVGDFSHGGGALRRIGAENFSAADGNGVSETFIPVYKIKILAGRNFIENDRRDVLLISRVSANRLGFATPQDAVGSRIEVKLDGMNEYDEVEIIGVFRDYRMEPYLNMDESNSQYANGGEGRGILLTYKGKLSPHFTPEKIAVKINTAELKPAIASIEISYKKIFPNDVFTWYFLDDHVNQVYNNEKITRNQVTLFTVLAFVIACLGLVAMMANRINEKTKEIGIRKILGAKGIQIAKILVQTTFLQFAIAVILGIPLAYYLGNQYLQKYSERITLFWWYAILPVTLLVFIMLISISTLLWKAVRTNPVESLRTE